MFFNLAKLTNFYLIGINHNISVVIMFFFSKRDHLRMKISNDQIFNLLTTHSNSMQLTT